MYCICILPSFQVAEGGVHGIPTTYPCNNPVRWVRLIDLWARRDLRAGLCKYRLPRCPDCILVSGCFFLAWFFPPLHKNKPRLWQWHRGSRVGIQRAKGCESQLSWLLSFPVAAFWNGKKTGDIPSISCVSSVSDILAWSRTQNREYAGGL